ncbi:Siroheme synthase [Vibrio ruber DSM 16370]|uniref:uroporphyrinogen-III C-methyltransferase n=1 Tax=Vibrio ruber (strain DSM 16370 / JCM 11486 / BCRC 17186 / CECT 7878 / LMG 23124 / VR1) TaxID=1123498 RepID=A0A1R4LM31_VIBR1|nr:uroporphyrinogen-III C-methyltransferase [Vibrio ruber]SJN57640.1 Siroheme synthase [Vibrio ruber DSM 16370]
MARDQVVTRLPVKPVRPSVKVDASEQISYHFTTSQLQAGEVALVGAGPGDPELLTVKAVNFLRQADVVLYDYLVSEEIMSLIPDSTILVCVGKRAGHHSVPQDKTNQLLVDFARQGHRVVRIKGGDPFIFGRGGEELESLFDAGIRFQVVPGITAAAGATAYAGIPLTHRDYAQSAIFVTGHVRAEQDEMDWSTLARGRQTLVIYMGLMKSGYIREQLIQHGRDAKTPVAVIERGTQAAQKLFRGTLDDLPQLAAQADSPALIVIGEVVSLSEKLNWFSSPQEAEPVLCMHK